MVNGDPALQPYKRDLITRELEAMSDWELERGCAAAEGFDQDRRIVADRILRQRYAEPKHGIATLVLSAIALGALAIALSES